MVRMVIESWIEVAYLEGRNDVALSSVTLGFGHALHVEVALEGCESHGASDDCCIITHCFQLAQILTVLSG
jgi:hypothetical protein